MRRADFFLIAFILILSFLLWFFPMHGEEETDTKWVLIKTDNDTYQYPLFEDKVIFLNENEYQLTLCIQNSTVSISHSTCPDHTCIHMSPIQKEGQTILCAPAKVLVSIQTREGDLDGISH